MRVESGVEQCELDLCDAGVEYAFWSECCAKTALRQYFCAWKKLQKIQYFSAAEKPVQLLFNFETIGFEKSHPHD